MTLGSETEVQGDVLFIQGIQKTGTSTLVGILNCHFDIFIMYEVRMYSSHISKYGNQWLAKYPGSRAFFRNTRDVGTPYLELAGYLNERHRNGNPYRYVGDKLITFDSRLTAGNQTYKTVFCMRDITTWLAKEQVVTYYRTDLDVIPVTIDYLRYVVETHLHPNCIRVRLEDVVRNNATVISALGEFLGIELAVAAAEWWNKIGIYPEDDPKAAVRWFANHGSSRIPPSAMDTSVELVAHPFWEDVRYWMDKYYWPDDAVAYSREEVDADIDRLAMLMKYSPLPLHRCYAQVSTQRFGRQRKRGRLRQLGRLAMRGMEQFKAIIAGG